jgi:hypothetical protein
MTLASEIAKLTSERYTLIKMQYGERRYQEFTLVSGDTYRLAWAGDAVKLFRNNMFFTLDTGLTADFTWYYDSSAGYVYARSSTAMEGGTVIFNALYYSSKENTHTYAVPTDSTTDLKYWRPKIKGNANISMSFSDTLAGTISIESSAIELDNTDREFENYLATNMTFNKKPVEVWISVNGEVTKVFDGVLGDVSLVQGSATFRILESINKMAQMCYMGDTKDECFFNKTAESAPNMYSGDDGAPFPYIFGRSATNLKAYAPISYVTAGPTTNYLDSYSLDTSASARLICTQSHAYATGTNNRVWVSGRTKGSFKTLDFGTINTALLKGNALGVGDYRVADVGGLEDTLLVRLNQSAVIILTYSTINHNLEVGDSFKVSGGTLGANILYVVVKHITYGGGTVYGQAVNRGGIIAALNLITCTFHTNSAPAIAIEYDNRVYTCCYELDFSVAYTATSGGNTRQVITFVDSFEANVDADTANDIHYRLTAIHPSSHKVYFRATQTASSSTHGESMLALVQNAQLETYDASFTAADTTLDVDCAFQVPYIGSTEYPTYLEVAQYICRSTLGYLKADNNGVNYNVVTAPGASTKTLTEDMISSISCNVSYGDAKAGIKLSNPHLNSIASLDAWDSDVESYNADLNESSETVEIEHCLSSVVDTMAPLLYNQAYRKVTYNISAPTALIDVELGDIVTIESPAILGGSGSVVGMVISLEKSDTISQATISDLKGLVILAD